MCQRPSVRHLTTYMLFGRTLFTSGTSSSRLPPLLAGRLKNFITNRYVQIPLYKKYNKHTARTLFFSIFSFKNGEKGGFLRFSFFLFYY